jgi:DNA-binding transcriptional MerR regulator
MSLQNDNLPEVPLCFGGKEYITRKELVRRAQAEGLDVEDRTIRYWATKDMFPRPYRLEGHKTPYYPASLLARLRVMVATRPKVIKKIRDELMASGLQSVRIGDRKFEVLPSMFEFDDNGYKCTLYKLADGSGDELLLVRRRNSTDKELIDK